MSIGDYPPRHGIGLALCKSIVNILKGDISIESDGGETYTLFEVRIPNLELTSAELEQVYHKPDLTRLKSITSSEINLLEEKK